MQILCLGDIAIGEKNLTAWKHPTGQNPPADYRIIFNWEIPAGERVNPVLRSSGPRLVAQKEALETLKNWSPGIATIATNHILDGGVDGMEENIRGLRQAGFSTVGAGQTQSEITRPLTWETGEGCLAILNWVFPETHPDWMAIPGPNCWPGIDAAARQIRDLKKQADWVMIIVHWSDEDFSYPTAQDRATARALAEAGADLIVGHHPHVVRGMETFGSCPVYYSLGNFFFSDFPGENGAWVVRRAPRNCEALGLQVTFHRGARPECKLLSFWQTAGQTRPDPLHRAERRVRQASRPLYKYDIASYIQWYQSQRRLFDQWGYRIHFRLWQRGLPGLVKFIKKSRKG